jgi:hypothetical protein
MKTDKERLKDELIKFIDEQEHEITKAELVLKLRNGHLKFQRVYLNKLKCNSK